MRRIAEQGCARQPVPTNSDRKSIDQSKHWLDLAIGNEGSKVGSPSLEWLGDMGQASFCIVEIDRRNPLFRLVQSNVDMQASIGIAMRKDTFARSDCHERAAADSIRAGLVARVLAGEERLDKTGARVRWL